MMGCRPPLHLSRHPRCHSRCQHIIRCSTAISGIKAGRCFGHAYELQPESYEELISLAGMGPQKARALALGADLIFGTEPSYQDPATYSFAQGQKTGIRTRWTGAHTIRRSRCCGMRSRLLRSGRKTKDPMTPNLSMNGRSDLMS
ncbi:MAG: DUF763 domain-containing protein [Methanosarcinales archaeon]|nr:MAG: DUF763 domain-containing protein [Methanosarcinales archaeon]